MIKIILRQTERERLDATREYCLGRIDLFMSYEDFSIEKVIREHLKFPFDVLILNDVPDLEVPVLVDQFSYETITAWIEENHAMEMLPKIDLLILVKGWPCSDLKNEFKDYL